MNSDDLDNQIRRRSAVSQTPSSLRGWKSSGTCDRELIDVAERGGERRRPRRRLQWSSVFGGQTIAPRRLA